MPDKHAQDVRLGTKEELAQHVLLVIIIYLMVIA